MPPETSTATAAATTNTNWLSSVLQPKISIVHSVDMATLQHLRMTILILVLLIFAGSMFLLLLKVMFSGKLAS